jgi:hypothetical protein
LYRNNVGDERPPRPEGFFGRLLAWVEQYIFRLDWFTRLAWNSDVRGRGSNRYDDGPWSPSRVDPETELPHAELSEEERKQALEEIRRRPRIG